MDHKITTFDANITLIMFNDSACNVDVDPVDLGKFLRQVFPSLESIECCGDGIWEVVKNLVGMERENIHRAE